uniref:Uncharacterized protein n=1 Tax=Anguilla anguilla TaxID=7936 RepID=A0A0E9T141_ANGAN
MSIIKIMLLKILKKYCNCKYTFNIS